MSAETIYEVIGYAGSILIVISLAMSSIIRLRIINLVGAATFALYGVLIGSLPVAITNIVIAGLDIWYLRKELTTREELKVIAVGIDDPFVGEFLSHYAVDIQRFRPGFDRGIDPDVAFLMLRDVNPAGVFIGTHDTDGVLSVDLDYVAPPYRDLRSGVCLYGRDGERFTERGWTSIVVEDVDDRQRDYFERMRFIDSGAGGMVRTFGGG
ncbi:MAG: hypothetical protein ABFR53_09465 [Actinomycetota bacterium]